ncbi:MAG: aminoacyl-tRNA hydrolase [Betaproteobacteria bacterium]|nr:aminoacyl-tRNA hydrolase [Betaproteobacteria bacterium]
MLNSTMRVTRSITLDESELVERFIHASGPGGQNVNKVATAVELRFDALRSPGLPEPVRARLLGLAGRRLSGAGVIVILAQRFRSQARNRADARERLAALIRAAATPPRTRVATRPPAAAKRRRLEEKRQRGTLKRERRSIENH